MGDAISQEPGSIILPTFLQPGGLEENEPLAVLSQDAVVASVNVPIDGDGRARRYARGFQHHHHYHQSLAAVLAGAPYGDARTFQIDYGIRLDDIESLSFYDVFRGTFDPEIVRGRNIIIGATALELGDEFSTPIRPGVPGVYVHALAYESMVQGRTLWTPSTWLTLALAMIVFWLLWPSQEPLNPKTWVLKQALALSSVIGLTLLAQALAPISPAPATALIAQIVCFVATVQRELSRRASDLLRQREEHLTFVALHDPETQLPNRRAMLERLKQALAAADQGVVIALALGVDRFAMLRGAIGYANANHIIAQLADNIARQSAQEEAFHLSTSTLGVTLTSTSEAAFLESYAAALDELETSIDIDGQDVEVVVRVGAAISADTGLSPEGLLEQATIALDQARLQNLPYCRFNAETFPDPKMQLALISDIPKGIARGDFSLVNQPKAAARDDVVGGAEALIRWRHPELGDIAPDRFIQIAEETGAINDLTRWVLRQVILDQATLKSGGLALRIAVNLSGRLLVDTGFCAAAIDAIRETGADICLEITETAIIGDASAAMASIAAFRAASVKVSIDDYGAGLSSLSYLKQIAAAELKLDKSLISDIKTSARDRLILKSTIDLAHGLGMSVVAEGVEDEATRAVLVGLGCDTLQGYLISRPIAFVELALRYTPASSSTPVSARALNQA